MSTTFDPMAAAEDASANAKSVVDNAKEKLTEAADHVKTTAGEYSRSAADQIDRNAKTAAGTLRSTANTLRSQAAGGDGRVSELAEVAASKLDASANYLGDFDSRQLFSQFEDWTRKNPGLAIGGALAVGFVLGMSLKRDRSY